MMKSQSLLLLLPLLIFTLLFLAGCNASSYTEERYHAIRIIDRKLDQLDDHHKPYKLHYSFPIDWLHELGALKASILRKLLLSSNKDVFYNVEGRETLVRALHVQLCPRDFFPLNTVKGAITKEVQCEIFDLLSLEQVLDAIPSPLLQDSSLKSLVNREDLRTRLRNAVLKLYKAEVLLALTKSPEYCILAFIYRPPFESGYSFLHDLISQRHQEEKRMQMALSQHSFFTREKILDIMSAPSMERRLSRHISNAMDKHLPASYLNFLLTVVLGRHWLDFLESQTEDIKVVNNDYMTWMSLVEHSALWFRKKMPNVFQTLMDEAKDWIGF